MELAIVTRSSILFIVKKELNLVIILGGNILLRDVIKTWPQTDENIFSFFISFLFCNCYPSSSIYCILSRQIEA